MEFKDFQRRFIIADLNIQLKLKLIRYLIGKICKNLLAGLIRSTIL